MQYRFVLNFFLLFVACMIFSPLGECREFIFVVNTSQSMNESDPLHVVQDSLTWSMENFSAEDEVAVIAFKDTPIIVRELSKIGDAPINAFEFDYSGESNAGEALLTAINMFKLDYGMERNIIVISNGEIALTNPAATLKSWEDFNACLQQAKWLGISVYVVKLRYFGAPQNYHSFAHDAKEIPGDYLDLMTTLRTLMFDTFHAPHMELPITNATQGNFFCEVPIFPTNSLKFFLLSSNPGIAELKSKSDEIISKDFAKIFKLNAPNANIFEFNVNYPQGTGLTLDAVAEVEGSLQTNLTTSIFSANLLEIMPVYNDSEQKKILDDDFFDDKSLRVQVDGKIIKSTIRDGVIIVELEDVGDEVSLDKVFFEDLGIIFIGKDSAQITVSVGLNYLPWILAFAGVSVILALSYLLSRKRKLSRTVQSKKHIAPIMPPELMLDKPLRDKNFFYKGELIISVMKNPSKDYIEPRTFNLFRLNSSEPIDLTAVLKACGIDFDFKDFQGITFSPSANGVYVENNSDCTLVKMNKTIVKGAYVELYHEDSADMATPDRSAELIVTYRNLKPT